MAFINVTLSEITDTAFPMFGAFELIETSGEVIVIHEKLSVVGVDIDHDTLSIPISVPLECTITAQVQGIMQIDTNEPLGISDIQGRTRFKVSSEFVVA